MTYRIEFSLAAARRWQVAAELLAQVPRPAAVKKLNCPGCGHGSSFFHGSRPSTIWDDPLAGPLRARRRALLSGIPDESRRRIGDSGRRRYH